MLEEKYFTSLSTLSTQEEERTLVSVKNKTHASHFSSTKFHKAELSQQKLPHLVTLRLEGKHPFDIELVLLVLCATTVKLADALHKAPLLDRTLVQHAEVSTKQSEDLCTP